MQLRRGRILRIPRELAMDWRHGREREHRDGLSNPFHSNPHSHNPQLNIPKAIPTYANEPLHKISRENQAEIAAFHRDCWEKVVRKLLVLIAIILELPEDYLANAHAYDEDSDDHLRYMIYNVRTQDEWDRAQAYSKGGHTDFGSLTLLFSQHVAGLQIRTPEGEWKYVKPVEGGITCNAADTLSFLTKGE
jgi:isopenicillin N synthase-like dioxygenase